MKKIIFLATIIIFISFQATLLNYIEVFGVKPDLPLIAVVIAALTFDIKWALFFSISSGILKDVFTLNTLAINTLLFALWGFLIIKLSKKMSLDNNFIRSLLVFIIVMLHNIFMRLIIIYLGKVSVSLGISLKIIFLESLYTALIAPLVFKLLEPLLTKD